MHRYADVMSFNVIINIFQIRLKKLVPSEFATGFDAKGTRSELILKNNKLFLTFYLR